MRINVKTIPNSKKYQVEKISDDYFKVRVDAKAENGRANKRLVEILSEYFKVQKSSIVIAKGLKSRNKIIEIKIL
jgi:uncharacterized protein (TIGR00251 family)